MSRNINLVKKKVMRSDGHMTTVWVKTGEKAESPKDNKHELAKQKRLLESLKHHHPGDDSPFGSGTVSETRKYLREKIKELKPALSKKQKEKKEEAEEKRYQKRYEESKKRDREKKKKLALLTERQKAINRLVDIKNSLSDIKAYVYRSGNYMRTQGEEVELRKEHKAIKKKHGIKSTEIRRQK